MMQNSPPLHDVSTSVNDPEVNQLTTMDTSRERMATVWVARITSVIGLICLALALGVWAFRQGHYRMVLALLTVAMFAAILHSYTFENGG